jgi:hypothetical protein
MARSVRWLLLLAVLPTSVAAAPPRAGGEFQVNTYTTDQQWATAVASDASGRFVAVWEGSGQDGDNGGIFGQRYDAAGTPLGGEFQVNVYTANRQFSAGVAMDPAGNFLVVWTAGGGQDGMDTGVFGRRYDASGVPLAGEFQVNVYTTYGQFSPSIAADAAGNFVVVWTSTGPARGIKARRYSAAGVGSLELTLSTYNTTSPSSPALAMNPDGSFVTTWSAFGLDGSDWGIFGRRFANTGAALGAAFAVNTYTTLAQDRSRVALTGGGAFTVVWQSDGQDGDGMGVFGRRYDAAGAPLGPELAISTHAPDDQQIPDVAADGTGGFIVAWESWNQDGSLAGVYARSFDATGAATDPAEFLVNTPTTNNQRSPAIASDTDGRFVVAWHGFPSDGGGSYSVRAQRFGDLIFKDGVEAGGLSAWSAAATDAGQLSVTAAAALAGTTRGLQGHVDDVNPLYVQDDSPADEGRYRARFYLDPNGFDPGESQLHRRLRTLIAFSEAPTRRVTAIVLRRIAGAYSLRARTRLDDDTQADTAFFPIDDRAHAVEFELVRASSPDALDGTFELWIDGVSVAQMSGLDNSRAQVDFARMGALSVKAGASGTLYFDEFESRRVSPIGLLP